MDRGLKNTYTPLIIVDKRPDWTIFLGNIHYSSFIRRLPSIGFSLPIKGEKQTYRYENSLFEYI